MKKRKKTRKKSSDAPAGGKKPQITLELFLTKCIREGKIRFWQKREIEAFFRDRKLKDKEDLEVYEDTLKKY